HGRSGRELLPAWPRVATGRVGVARAALIDELEFRKVRRDISYDRVQNAGRRSEVSRHLEPSKERKYQVRRQLVRPRRDKAIGAEPLNRIGRRFGRETTPDREFDIVHQVVKHDGHGATNRDRKSVVEGK